MILYSDIKTRTLESNRQWVVCTEYLYNKVLSVGQYGGSHYEENCIHK